MSGFRGRSFRGNSSSRGNFRGNSSTFGGSSYRGNRASSSYSNDSRRYSPIRDSSSRGFSRGSTGFTRGSSGYSPGSSGFSIGSSGYSPGSSSLYRGSGEFSRSTSGYSPGSSAFPRDFNKFSSGSNEFSSGSGRFSRDSNEFSRGSSRFPRGSRRFTRGSSRGYSRGFGYKQDSIRGSRSSPPPYRRGRWNASRSSGSSRDGFLHESSSQYGERRRERSRGGKRNKRDDSESEHETDRKKMKTSHEERKKSVKGLGKDDSVMAEEKSQPSTSTAAVAVDNEKSKAKVRKVVTKATSLAALRRQKIEKLRLRLLGKQSEDVISKKVNVNSRQEDGNTGDKCEASAINKTDGVVLEEREIAEEIGGNMEANEKRVKGSAAEVGSSQQVENKEGADVKKIPPWERMKEKRDFIHLKCPHCDYYGETFKAYARHLSDYRHKNMVSSIASNMRKDMRHLRKMQKKEQMEYEENFRVGLLRAPQFCNLCELSYRTPRQDHTMTDRHVEMVELTNHYCKPCREKFKNSLNYLNHTCSISHIKRQHSWDEKYGKKDDESFMVLDSVGEEDTDVYDGIDDNDAEKLAQKYGQSKIYAMHVFYCDVCESFLNRPGVTKRVQIQEHLRSRYHLTRIAKMARINEKLDANDDEDIPKVESEKLSDAEGGKLISTQEKGEGETGEKDGEKEKGEGETGEKDGEKEKGEGETGEKDGEKDEQAINIVEADVNEDVDIALAEKEDNFDKINELVLKGQVELKKCLDVLSEIGEPDEVGEQPENIENHEQVECDNDEWLELNPEYEVEDNVDVN